MRRNFSFCIIKGKKKMKTLLLEGDILLADTFTPLTSRGSETAPSLQLPADWSKINKIIAAVSYDQAAPGSTIFILRLTGAGISGTQDIVIAGGGGQTVQTGSDAAPLSMENFILEDADIEAEGGDVLSVQAAMTDTDLGTARVIVSLYGS
jgi:hypothetical protein